MVAKSELPFVVAKLSSVAVESFGKAGLERAIYGDWRRYSRAITEMMREIIEQVEMGFFVASSAAAEIVIVAQCTSGE